jgi:hypothetical protein
LAYLLLSSACCGLLAEPATRVPMTLVGPNPAIEVHVNGKGPFLFLIDTGASGPGRWVNIGSRLLADFRVSLDLGNHRVRFERLGPEPGQKAQGPAAEAK